MELPPAQPTTANRLTRVVSRWIFQETEPAILPFSSLSPALKQLHASELSISSSGHVQVTSLLRLRAIPDTMQLHGKQPISPHLASKHARAQTQETHLFSQVVNVMVPA